jgi:MFS family permease
MSPTLVLTESPVAETVPVVEPSTHRPLVRMVLLASITVSFLAASAAPTPLYGTYQHEWGFSDLTITVIFGVYALAFLGALLTLGRLSDHIGRRPILFAGIAGQLLALAIFIDAHSLVALLVARIVQGLAAGTAIGAIGAGMLDIDPVRGAVANATAPGLGTGSGVLISSFAVQWLPAPTRLVYLVIAGILLVQTLGVVLLPETSPRTPGARQSLVPQIELPTQICRPMMAAAPVLFAVWALAGFYGSLGPSLADHLASSASVVEGGLGLGLLALIAAATTYLLRARPASQVMMIGTSTLIAGVGVVLWSLWIDSTALFFAGTAVAGIGFGAGFQGGMRLVAPLAHPDQRAGVLSALFIVSYVGLGVPAVLAGLAVVDGSGLMTTSYEYGLAVIVLGLIASINLIRNNHQITTSTEEVADD